MSSVRIGGPAACRAADKDESAAAGPIEAGATFVAARRLASRARVTRRFGARRRASADTRAIISKPRPRRECARRRPTGGASSLFAAAAAAAALAFKWPPWHSSRGHSFDGHFWRGAIVAGVVTKTSAS